METKFNFKSQICTRREQSRRLLALGLKPDTADMSSDGWNDPVVSWGMEWSKEVIESGRLPAWSLGRLWELYWSNKVVSDCLFGCGKCMNPYAKMIAMIEYDIEDGTFNKDYLDK